MSQNYQKTKTVFQEINNTIDTIPAAETIYKADGTTVAVSSVGNSNVVTFDGASPKFDLHKPNFRVGDYLLINNQLLEITGYNDDRLFLRNDVTAVVVGATMMIARNRKYKMVSIKIKTGAGAALIDGQAIDSELGFTNQAENGLKPLLCDTVTNATIAYINAEE